METNKIITTADGSHSLHSNEFGVSYHSKYGAIQEAYHVFIDAALRFKAVLKPEITILEIGFGTGLNAFVSLLEAKKRNLKIQYTAVEAFPISDQIAKALNYSSLLPGGETSNKEFLEMHLAPWDSVVEIGSHFQLNKQSKKIETINDQALYDIIYFDAFAPDAQPELWTEEIFTKMFNALQSEGILVTYCAKGSVKRIMKKVGFLIEALKGPPGKREMTRAVKPT